MVKIERLPGDRMFIGPICRGGLGVASAILIISSANDISIRSSGAYDWANETSLAALQLRALGYQKLALGFALGALSAAGIKEEEAREEGRKHSEQVAKYKEEEEKKSATLSEGKRWDVTSNTLMNPNEKKTISPPSIPPAFPPHSSQND